MGYSNNQNSPGAIAVDLETIPMDGAAEYVPGPEPVPPLDLEAIKPARNLKDVTKIAEDLVKRRAAAVEAHAEKAQQQAQAHAEKLGKAALDFNLARIVAIAWSDGGTPVTLMCENETDERNALELFWSSSAGRTLVGFRIRAFDAPMLMARSRYLGVKFPLLDLGSYSRSGRIVDLYDVWNFGLKPYDMTSVMSLGLKSIAKRIGLTVADEIDGKEIPALVQAGDWDAVRSHVESDVRLTVGVAQFLGVMRTVDVAA
jgi:DNA polymerase elongation subunit (family B)